jgi:hypothetical protein
MASDGLLTSSSATVTITVDPVNDAPAAGNDDSAEATVTIVVDSAATAIADAYTTPVEPPYLLCAL